MLTLLGSLTHFHCTVDVLENAVKDILSKKAKENIPSDKAEENESEYIDLK